MYVHKYVCDISFFTVNRLCFTIDYTQNRKIKTSYLITINIYIIFLIKQKKIIGVHSLIQKVMGTLICKQI